MIYWLQLKKLEACPRCGSSPLKDVTKRRQEWKSGFRTRTAAESGLSEALAKLGNGTHVIASSETLGEFLEAEWLPTAAARVRPSTLASYRINLRCHVMPALGNLRLQAVTAARINAFYADLTAQGLAPKTVRNIAALLSKVLNDAARWGKIPRNPATLADKPRVPRREMHVWGPVQLRTFLRTARGDRL